MAPQLKKKKSLGIPRTIQDRLLEKINQPQEAGGSDNRVVQFWPDREDDLSFLLSGSPSEIKTQASLLKALHEYFEDLDVGVIVGQSLNDIVARKIDLGLELNILLRGSYKKPFYQADSNSYQDRIQRNFSVPFAKTPTFEEVKQVFDLSDNGYPYQRWGEWSARAWLSANNNEKSLIGLPQVVACGDTEARAVSNLNKILKLTNGKIIDQTTKHDRNPEIGQKQFKVYPYKLVVYHKQLTFVAKGRKTKSGNIASRRGVLTLYQKTEPLGWGKKIRDLTRGV